MLALIEMDTRLIFTDEEYIGNPDDELAREGAADQVSTVQSSEVAPEEFELANGWFLSLIVRAATRKR